MNTREQMLKMRNEMLSRQVQFLANLLDRSEKAREVSESVACAFAFDLHTTLGHFWVGSEVPAATLKLWEDAIANAERAAEGA